MAKVQRVKNSEGQKRLNIALKGLDGVQGKAGYFESAKYPNGTPVAYVATIQEFGATAQGIPPRPTMRPAAKQTALEWKAQSASAMKAVLAGTETIFTVMEKISARAAGNIKKEISTLISPPLKTSTILSRARRSASGEVTASLSKPLIDTKILFNSATWRVDYK